MARPRQNRELQGALKELKNERRKLSKKLRQFPGKLISDKARHARYAAYIFLVLVRGTAQQREASRPKLQALREWGRLHGFDDRALRQGGQFLDAFIERFAPGWDWRKDINTGELAAQDAAIAEKEAEIQQTTKAAEDRFFTASKPSVEHLYAFRRIAVNDSTTWPTFSELKLATAIPERSIRKFVDSWSPTRGEIVRVPLRRRHQAQGAFPKRVGPRLVYMLLQEFLRNKPVHSLGDQAELAIAKHAAIVGKRSLAAKIAASR